MTLWANLHGGFVLGLVLIGAVALDAFGTSRRRTRWFAARRWFVVGRHSARVLPHALWLAARSRRRKISSSSVSALSHIAEWRAGGFFTQAGAVRGMLMLALSAPRCRGVRLSPPRILLRSACCRWRRPYPQRRESSHSSRRSWWQSRCRPVRGGRRRSRGCPCQRPVAVVASGSAGIRPRSPAPCYVPRREVSDGRLLRR